MYNCIYIFIYTCNMHAYILKIKIKYVHVIYFVCTSITYNYICNNIYIMISVCNRNIGE